VVSDFVVDMVTELPLTYLNILAKFIPGFAIIILTLLCNWVRKAKKEAFMERYISVLGKIYIVIWTINWIEYFNFKDFYFVAIPNYEPGQGHLPEKMWNFLERVMLLSRVSNASLKLPVWILISSV
jgi:hypothetical protein